MPRAPSFPQLHRGKGGNPQTSTRRLPRRTSFVSNPRNTLLRRPSMTKRIAYLAALAAVAALFPAQVLQAQQPPAGIRWDFNESSGAKTHDSIGNLDDAIEGFSWRGPGAEGNGLQFDGYT